MPPQIHALSIRQDGSLARWKARGAVAGAGWLKAWGTSLTKALEALQALAAERVAMHEQEDM